jgi:hypothetical protein
MRPRHRPTRSCRAFGAAVLAAASALTAVGAVLGVPAGAATEPSERSTATATATERCLQARTVSPVIGRQTGRYTADVAAGETVDALGAWWLQVGNWPVSFGGGAGGCWLGGRIVGTWPQSTPWSTFHHTGGLDVKNPKFTIVGLRVHNIGDGIRIIAGARDFRITGVHLSFMHDDCVENDQLYSGVIEDSLFDGCYVGFSARPAHGESADGHRNTETFRNNVVRLQPTPTVYKGHAPGTGGFFKWDEQGRAPKLVIEDNVFRADRRPNHQDLTVPRGYRVRCRNNVVVWLGKGPYPDRLPKCFRVTRDRRVWDRAVANWYAAHPSNP